MALDLPELDAYLREVFPQMYEMGLSLDAVGPNVATARLSVSGPRGARHLRPGGTVSGPSMAALADCGFYAATLAMIGKQPLAVTVNMGFTFLRKPAVADLICEARILKLGRRMSLGDCLIYSEGEAEPVAQATMSYALPSSG